MHSDRQLFSLSYFQSMQKRVWVIIINMQILKQHLTDLSVCFTSFIFYIFQVFCHSYCFQNYSLGSTKLKCDSSIVRWAIIFCVLCYNYRQLNTYGFMTYVLLFMSLYANAPSLCVLSYVVSSSQAVVLIYIFACILHKARNE